MTIDRRPPKKNQFPILSRLVKSIEKRSGLQTGFLLLSTGFLAEKASATDKEALHFIPNSELIVFAVEQNNGDFWLKLTDGKWIKVPAKFVNVADGVVVVSQNWLIKNAPFLVSNPKTKQGDYVAFEISSPKTKDIDSSQVNYLQPNLPGLHSAEFMQGGAIAIKLNGGGSISLNPKHFVINDNKIIVSADWLEAYLPNVAIEVGKNFKFLSLIGWFSDEIPSRYENKKYLELQNTVSVKSYDGAGYEIVLNNGQVILAPHYAIELNDGKIYLNSQAFYEINDRPKLWLEGDSSSDEVSEASYVYPILGWEH